MKKVSVILPNYNYANFFEERIDGILAQTYPIYELVVLDDASTDNSIEVMKRKLSEIRKTHPDLKIRALVNRKNSGSVFAQWQKGIELSSGEYIWIAELDDGAEPEFLETVMKGFENPKTVLSYTNSKMVGENGRRDFKSTLRKPLNFIREDRPSKDYIRSGEEELSRVLCVYNTIPNVSAVVFKKDPKINFQEILEQAKKFRLAGDWYFYSEILLHGKIAYFKRPLNIHRLHKTSVTETTDRKTHFDEIKFMHEKIRKDVKISPNSVKKIQSSEMRLRKAWKIS